MDINQAQTIIEQEADKLTAALHAKGYERSHAEIWIGRDSGVTIFIKDCPVGFLYPNRASVAEAIEEFDKRFAALPDAHAADAWFDPAHPMNQPVTQAAE